ncbi:hypothetical protein [Enterocloster asparagiformis]|uniref:hypothetical protein n=1 Tax=Enterocloster asparagiformis TaxID=333367 RepID=UPI003A7F2F7D
MAEMNFQTHPSSCASLRSPAHPSRGGSAYPLRKKISPPLTIPHFPEYTILNQSNTVR